MWSGGPVCPAGLLSVYPNPADDQFAIGFYHPVAGKIQVIVSDELGRVLKTIVYGNEPVGPLTKWVDISHFATGIYFLQLRDNGKISAGKVFKK